MHFALGCQSVRLEANLAGEPTQKSESALDRRTSVGTVGRAATTYMRPKASPKGARLPAQAVLVVPVVDLKVAS